MKLQNGLPCILEWNQNHSLAMKLAILGQVMFPKTTKAYICLLEFKID